MRCYTCDMSNTEIEDIETPPGSSPLEESRSRQSRHFVKRAGGGVLVAIGFILSPFSWWNDLLINIPLAYLFAATVALLNSAWFNPAFVVGYLLTNIVGMLMLQYGMKHAVRSRKSSDIKKEIKSSFVWSLLYTLLIVVLLMTGWIRPPQEYFQ